MNRPSRDVMAAITAVVMAMTERKTNIVVKFIKRTTICFALNILH